MLLYQKKVSDRRPIFGAENNIPSASDQQAEYKDNSGSSVDITDKNFFYNKNKAMYAGTSTAQLPQDDDVKVNVWVGDTLVIGSVDEVTDPKDESDSEDNEE